VVDGLADLPQISPQLGLLGSLDLQASKGERNAGQKQQDCN
jgi:hypothetical protein